jgi:hypothetical protein
LGYYLIILLLTSTSGLSSQGFVANEVETEQIVDAGIDWATGQPLWSAMVQVGDSCSGVLLSDALVQGVKVTGLLVGCLASAA